MVLARDLGAAASEAIRRLSAGEDPALAGLLLEPEQVRVYPQSGGGPRTSLAAHLLGFVNRDGVGQYGVEQFYQDGLAGSATVFAAQRDAAGNARPGHVGRARGRVPGQEPDADDRRVAPGRGRGGAAPRVDRRPGEARLGGRDGPVHRRGLRLRAATRRSTRTQYQAIAAEDPGVFVDPIVSTVYEPGSVFKMMTATAALEPRHRDARRRGSATRPRSASTAARRTSTTRTTSRTATGTFEDQIAYSRNVVAAKVALDLGRNTDGRPASAVLDLADARLRVPDGHRRRQRGRRHRPRPGRPPWRQIDLANGSFGQGVAVTPIQLAQAFGAMVNGGVLVQPRVVRTVGDARPRRSSAGRVMSLGHARERSPG